MSDQATALRRAIEQARVSREPAHGHGSSDDSSAASATGIAVHEETDHGLPPSVASGAVSFAPLPGRHRPVPRVAPARIKLAKAIAISSGKGGVGKSNLAVNLAVLMSRMGLKVCLLDADMGLANADVLCNLTPKLTLEHVVAGKCKLWEAMMLAPGGFRLIPGASGVARMAELNIDDRRRLLQQLAALERVADVLIIDTGAGINSTVVSFAGAAHTALVTTTPEPTSLTDAYGMIKTLARRTIPSESNIELVVNMTISPDEGRNVFGRMERVSRTFLGREIAFAGAIPTDPAVPTSVRQRVPFVLYAPDAPATQALRVLARRLVGVDDPYEVPTVRQQRSGFFARIASWMTPQRASREK